MSVPTDMHWQARQHDHIYAFCRGLIKWFTGEDIKLDEYLHPNLTLTYNRKRDYWNGYNPDAHQAVVEEYAKMEMVKKQLKADRLHQGMYVCIEE